MKRHTVNENPKEDDTPQEPESIRSSLRPKRGKLWDHPEEELPLLTSPLEVDSETPVADALIKRLQDEEEKEEGTFEIVCTLEMYSKFYPAQIKCFFLLFRFMFDFFFFLLSSLNVLMVNLL